MCLNSHYRKQIVFSYDNLENATIAYNKLKNKVQNLKDDSEINNEEFNKWDKEFKNYLEDDLNIPNTITLIYDLLKSDVNDSTKIKLIKSWDQVLSLDLLKNEEIDEDLEKKIEEKILERNEAKKNKDYNLADKIRDELLEKGIALKDTREGTTYEILK